MGKEDHLAAGKVPFVDSAVARAQLGKLSPNSLEGSYATRAD